MLGRGQLVRFIPGSFGGFGIYIYKKKAYIRRQLVHARVQHRHGPNHLHTLAVRYDKAHSDFLSTLLNGSLNVPGFLLESLLVLR